MTAPVTLPSGSGWQPSQFTIAPAGLVVLAGTAAGALTATHEMRLIHNPLATYPPAPIAATLGVDNIALRAAGSPSGVDDLVELPPAAGLKGVFPNPFNPSVAISYELDRAGAARVAVYDPQGHLIRVLEQGVYPAGTRTVAWDGTGRDGRRQASGTYVVEVAGDYFHDWSMVTLLK